MTVKVLLKASLAEATYPGRNLFTWILVAFALSNIAVALAPNYWTVLIARIVPAALLPVFWGVGSDAAGKLVAKEKAGKAISQVYFGVTAALLFGLPLGTVLGDAVGWRGAFWVLAVLSLAMAILLHKVMPKLSPGPQESLKSQIATLANRFFIANLLLSLGVFTAMFGAYTYLADMLERSGGIAPAQVGWWLMGFGTVGLLGNYLAGRLVDEHAVKANILFCLMLGAGAASTALFAGQPQLFVASLVIWGVAHTALFPLGQIRVINAARSGKALAGTLNISACNSGIAAGAILGGWAIDFSGITAAILAASVLIVLCAFATPAVERLRPDV
ncbi:MFS transporter [Klebsiella pneumoniae]|nr:MFS transporter [Klebsiella pneumoniae]